MTKPSFLLLAAALLALAGCSDDEEFAAVPLPECPNANYELCNVGSSDCQARLRSLAACLYGADEAPKVPIRVISEAALRDELASGLQEAMPTATERKARDFMEDVLHDLGLVESGALSDEATIDNIVDTVAGLYVDPETGILLLDKRMGLSTLEANGLLLHELIHSLQDADYELGRWIEPYREVTDQLLAARALYEGQATFYQFRAGAAWLGSAETDIDWETTFQNLRDDLIARAVSAPSPYVASSSTFPYAYGVSMSHHAWLDDGQGFERPLFDDPALTTREVMLRAEPERAPMSLPVVLPAPTDTGDFTLVDEDVLGAWNLGLFINANQAETDELSLAVTREYAKDWHADRLWLYEDADGKRGWLWEIELESSVTPSQIVDKVSDQLPRGVEVEEQDGRLYFASGSDGAPQFLLDAGAAFLDGRASSED